MLFSRSLFKHAGSIHPRFVLIQICGGVVLHEIECLLNWNRARQYLFLDQCYAGFGEHQMKGGSSFHESSGAETEKLVEQARMGLRSSQLCLETKVTKECVLHSHIMPSTDADASEVLGSVAGASLHENVVIEEIYREEAVVAGISLNETSITPTKLSLSTQTDSKEVEGRSQNCSASTNSRYLTLEPSLAMDWLEIAWEELHIKERVGAGSFTSRHLCLNLFLLV